MNIKFKYDNQTKESFIKDLGYMAKQKRADAAILISQAEAMEDTIRYVDSQIIEELP